MVPTLHAVLLFIHLAAAVVWIGGMVFAQVALRPAAMQVLDPPLRLPLMAAALGRFFRLVALAVPAILASGGLLMAPVGMAQAPIGWHAMLGAGSVMAVVFAWIVAVPYPALRRAVAAGQWPVAAAALQRIRQLVGVNLMLGTLAVAAAVLARG